MTDDQSNNRSLGAPPQPPEAARTNSIEAALARYDELVIDGQLTPGDSPDTTQATDSSADAPSEPPIDELSRRRQRRDTWASPQRLLAAAATVVVLGVGGVVAAQALGSGSEDTTSADQAEAPSAVASTEADPSAAEGSATAATGTVPESAEADPVGATEPGAAGPSERNPSGAAGNDEEIVDKSAEPAGDSGDSDLSGDTSDAAAPPNSPEPGIAPEAPGAGSDPAPRRLPSWVCRLLSAFNLAAC